MMLLARKIMIQDLFVFTDVYMAGYIAYTCTPKVPQYKPYTCLCIFFFFFKFQISRLKQLC